MRLFGLVVMRLLSLGLVMEPTKDTFTAKKSFLMQTASLEAWKTVLTEDAYLSLCCEVGRQNCKTALLNEGNLMNADPYSIFRGQDLDSAVHAIAFGQSFIA